MSIVIRKFQRITTLPEHIINEAKRLGINAEEYLALPLKPLCGRDGVAYLLRGGGKIAVLVEERGSLKPRGVFKELADAVMAIC